MPPLAGLNVIKIRICSSVCLLLCLLLSSTRLWGADNGTSILIISSYNPETSQTATNISTFLDEYNRLGGETSSVIIENMNCKSFSEATLWKRKMKDILTKHTQSSTPPDLILVLGQEAWSAYLSQEESVQCSIPVMCGMASRNAIILPEDSLSIKEWHPESVDVFAEIKNINIVAGFAYEYNVKKNIRLIQQLYPDVKNIAFVSDNTYGGVAMQALVREEMQAFPDLNLILLDGRMHTIYSMVSEISQLPAHTALLVGTWRIDMNDGYFMSNATYAMKDANRKVPAFSIASVGLGYWALGGYMPEYMPVGEDLARQAFKYFNEKSRGSVQIKFIPNHYVFDIVKLDEWGISHSLLPKDGGDIAFVNKTESFWERYKYHITIATLIFFITLMGLLVSLFFYVRTRKLMGKLEKSEKELRKARDKAEESNRLKSAFIANMSHEIRTPLNAIVGFSNLLIPDDPTEEQTAYFDIIQTNTDLLLHLINDILDISRLESGKMKFVYENCEIVGLCKNALSTAEQARRTAAQYLFTGNVASFSVRTDVQRLQQVLNNLLSNAGKFTEQGSITLDCTVDDAAQLIYISVTDTGRGIPKEKQKLVFERFEKLDEYVQGTGLGLSITQLIVERLGGDIWVDSEYDNGARFVFTHPFHVDEEDNED